MTTMEGLVTELQVQRVVWRRRLDDLRVERDRAQSDFRSRDEFNQFYGAIEVLMQVIVEIDHILEDINDERPFSGVQPGECLGCGSRGEVHRPWCSDLPAGAPTA